MADRIKGITIELDGDTPRNLGDRHQRGIPSVNLEYLKV